MIKQDGAHMKTEKDCTEEEKQKELQNEENDRREQKERDRKQYGNDFNRFMYSFGTLILVNIYFLLCSIPVITFGASLTAASNVCYKIREDGDVRVTKTFFTIFGKNILNSTLVWIVYAGFASMFGFMFYQGFKVVSGNAGIALCVIGAIGVAVLTMCATYVFLLIGRYDNNLLEHIANAFRIGFGNLGWTLVIWIIWAVCLVLFLSFDWMIKYVGWIWLLCGFALLIYASVCLQRRVLCVIENNTGKDC